MKRRVVVHFIFFFLFFISPLWAQEAPKPREIEFFPIEPRVDYKGIAAAIPDALVSGKAGERTELVDKINKTTFKLVGEFNEEGTQIAKFKLKQYQTVKVSTGWFSSREELQPERNEYGNEIILEAPTSVVKNENGKEKYYYVISVPMEENTIQIEYSIDDLDENGRQNVVLSLKGVPSYVASTASGSSTPILNDHRYQFYIQKTKTDIWTFRGEITDKKENCCDERRLKQDTARQPDIDLPACKDCSKLRKVDSEISKMKLNFSADADRSGGRSIEVFGTDVKGKPRHEESQVYHIENAAIETQGFCLATPYDAIKEAFPALPPLIQNVGAILIAL